MKDHFRASNGDWQPAHLLYSWTNLIGQAAVHRLRDPSKSVTSSWKERIAIVTKLIILHLYRIISLFCTPLARAFAAACWCVSGGAAVGSVAKRIVSALLGWQNQKIGRRWRIIDSDLVPAIRRWHISLGIVLLGGLLYRAATLLWSVCNHAARRERSIEKCMKRAENFEEWQELASDLDAIQVETRQRASTGLYDERLLADKVAGLNLLRRNGHVEELMFVLRSDLTRDYANITNRDIHHNRYILPKPIREYHSTVNSCLDYIADAHVGVSEADKRDFFYKMRITYGRSALVLSGGGALGAFHLGVVRALLEQGLLPRILAGSSVGSIVAAIAAVHTDEELFKLYNNINDFSLDFFANNSTLEALSHLFKTGTLQDVVYLKKRLRLLLSDVTFQEAHERTHRYLNVTVTAADTNEPPRMLNYLTAPNVVIWSAVAASSAFPGLFPPQDIMMVNRAGEYVRFASPDREGAQRRWHDGSLENDLPFRELAETFNVKNFIVSQTNPHLVPLMTLREMVPAPVFGLLQAEFKHVFHQAQLYTPTWLPTKWMRLFTQAWEGDVTIVMPWTLYSRSISKAIHNPSQMELIDADDLGKKGVWEHLSAIQGNCAIELKLDECYARLLRGNPEDEGHLSPSTRSTLRKTRIHSWANVPSMATFTSAIRSIPTAVFGLQAPMLEHGQQLPHRHGSDSASSSEYARIASTTPGGGMSIATSRGAAGHSETPGTRHVPRSYGEVSRNQEDFQETSGSPASFAVASVSSSSGDRLDTDAARAVAAGSSGLEPRQDGHTHVPGGALDDEHVGRSYSSEAVGYQLDALTLAQAPELAGALPARRASSYALDVIAP